MGFGFVLIGMGIGSYCLNGVNIWAIIFIVIGTVIILSSDKNSNELTSLGSNSSSPRAHCNARTSGTYSSILNDFEKDISYVLYAMRNCYNPEVSVTVQIQNIYSDKISIYFSIDADCHKFSDYGITFGHEFTIDENGVRASFRTNEAQGPARVDDIENELRLQFDWNNILISNFNLRTMQNGYYTNNPSIFLSFRAIYENN